MRLATKFAGIFSSFTILIVGSVVLFKSMTIDFDSVFFALRLSLTGALAAGFFGFHIGKIFEGSNKHHNKNKKQVKKSKLLIDDILDKDIETTQPEEA